MKKDYYTFEELDSIEEQLFNMVGSEELYTAVSKWLGYDKLGEFMKDYCRDYDIELDSEVLENEK